MKIPAIFQSSVNPEEVSLTVSSIGKGGAYFIVFLGMIGWVDPSIAGQAWGGLVASVITAIPAGFAVWSAGQAVYGIVRKIAVRVVSLRSTTTV